MSNERLAVVVVHGMGQQLPYETVDRVVSKLHEPTPDAPVAKRDKLGKDSLSYVETRVAGKTVDVFEAYWAPTTEGRVTLRDVIGFLTGAAWNGIKNAKRGTAWREDRGGAKKPVTVLLLSYIASVLGALIAMNLVIATLTARSLAGLRAAPPALVSDLTYVFLGFLAILGLFGASIWLAGRQRAAAPAARVLLHVTLAGTIAAALAIGALLSFRGSATAPLIGPVHPIVVGATWIALAGASYAIRNVLVQYLGDVAAYVSSHKLDRFTLLREEIRESVGRVMSNVYAAKDDNAPRYAGVAIVGHSLGSVVAYETLNALVLADGAADPKERVDVAGRTRLLLTFGSPLDKTAYLFAQSAGKSSEVREALISLKQPLLSTPESRPLAWINVHAKADPVSGKLDFYDGAPGSRPVQNEIDPDATTPLIAHNEYWTNPTVWRFLRAELAKTPVGKREIQIARSVPVRARGIEAKAEKAQ